MKKNSIPDRLFDLLHLRRAVSLPTSRTMPVAERTEGQELRFHPQVKERYSIQRVLGKGGFGIVYLARDRRLGRLVALKQLFPKYRRNRDMVKRFLQEAQIAGQIDNPNIVTIFDAPGEDDAICIIMEYLAAGNLDMLLAERGPVDTGTALRYMLDILNGLVGAHAMRVIHRDIKPGNILFDQRGRLKIGDFGVAHLPADAGGLDEDAVAAGPVGTPDYMAPEQVANSLKLDARMDIFSAGALFFEMLSGQRVFSLSGKKDFTAITKVLRFSRIPKIEEVVPDLDPMVSRLVNRFLERNPDARFQTAVEAMDAVRKTADALGFSTMFVAPPYPNPGPEINAAVNREKFEDILRLFLVDGVVSPPERRELQHRAQRLGIEAQQALQLEDGIRRELNLPTLAQLAAFEKRVEELLQDRDFSDEDHRILDDLAAQYGLVPEERRKIEDAVMIKFRMMKE